MILNKHVDIDIEAQLPTLPLFNTGFLSISNVIVENDNWRQRSKSSIHQIVHAVNFGYSFYTQ